MAYKVETLIWADGTHFHHYRNVPPSTKQDWLDWANKELARGSTRELVIKITSDNNFINIIQVTDLSEQAALQTKRWMQSTYNSLPAHTGKMLGKMA